MQITALAPWFGAKRTMAQRVIAELGAHRTYWEPFCGSMAVLLAKPQCAMETVNDMHGDITNLARVIRDPLDGPRLYRRLRRTLCEDTLPAEACGILMSETDPCERAYWYFLESWLGRNGCAGTGSSNNGFCVRYTGQGGSPSVRLESAVKSIPAWRRRMRRVIVLRKDAFQLLDRIEDRADVAIYCDPPYIVKGAKYRHDFEEPDHDRLAKALSRFARARVVVSYYDHPRIAELYPTWRKVEHIVPKAMANQGQRNSRHNAQATEILLVNTQKEPTP